MHAHLHIISWTSLSLGHLPSSLWAYIVFLLSFSIYGVKPLFIGSYLFKRSFSCSLSLLSKSGGLFSCPFCVEACFHLITLLFPVNLYMCVPLLSAMTMKFLHSFFPTHKPYSVCKVLFCFGWCFSSNTSIWCSSILDVIFDTRVWLAPNSFSLIKW